jgi:hypothetical protein
VVFCGTPAQDPESVFVLAFEVHNKFHQVHLWPYELSEYLRKISVLRKVMNLHDYLGAKILKRECKYFIGKTVSIIDELLKFGVLIVLDARVVISNQLNVVFRDLSLFLMQHKLLEHLLHLIDLLIVVELHLFVRVLDDLSFLLKYVEVDLFALLKQELVELDQVFFLDE